MSPGNALNYSQGAEGPIASQHYLFMRNQKYLKITKAAKPLSSMSQLPSLWGPTVAQSEVTAA